MLRSRLLSSPSGGRGGTGACGCCPITALPAQSASPFSGTDLLQGPPPSPRVLSPLSRPQTFPLHPLPLPSIALPDPYSALSPGPGCSPGSLQAPSPLGLLPRMVWLMLVSTSSGFLWSLALVPTIHITLAHLNYVL